jgi:branched-chain amino acid aminotransferase/4-amino-4-deoxychorismate lyase
MTIPLDTTIPFDDRGFTLGDGLFETVLSQDGVLDLWPEHVERMTRGCATLGLPAPKEALLRTEALAALEAAGLTKGRAAVRLSWTAGRGGRGLERPATLAPRLSILAMPAPAPEGPARLVTASVRRNETSPVSRLKTLSYLDQVLARREALAAGGDEALMLNGAGLIACAAAANIFWMARGVLYTPAIDCGVLDGVMRARVIARSPARTVEVHAPAAALAEAEAVFITNSLIGLRAVAAIDGRPMGGEARVSALRDALQL